jgi:hypothetical protein
LALISSSVEYLRPGCFDSLAIESTGQECPTTSVLFELFQALHRFCSPALLKSLVLQQWTTMEDFMHPSSVLHGLFVFRNITELNVEYCFNLGDDDMKQLARAWPQLHTLSLRSANHVQQSCITLQGLTELIVRCPLLSNSRRDSKFLEIDIHVSNHGLQTIKNQKTAGIQNRYVQFILFNHSTCEADVDLVELAECLQEIFPRLLSIESWSGGQWKEAAKLINVGL